MLTAPTTTLAYHQSRPLTVSRDMRKVPLAQAVARMKEFMAKDPNSSTVPETEALWFYGLNQAMALIKQVHAPLEPLPPARLALVEKYYDRVSEKAVRAFYYMLIICTREARHTHYSPTLGAKLLAQHGQAVRDFIQLICTTGEAQALNHLLKNPPPVTLGDYVHGLQTTFYQGAFSGGFGGPNWGKVTDCMCSFVDGVFTPEMMLDTVWTLCHNNGPIFNKGHLYGMYTETLTRILDVQRSGQVVEALLFDSPVQMFVDAELQQSAKVIRQEFPDKIGEYVDWFVVEALGALHKYEADKAKQVKQYGVSAAADAAQKKAAAAAATAAKKAQEEAEAEAKLWFVVMPGVKVKKLKRAA